jgi:hypothetical protein
MSIDVRLSLKDLSQEEQTYYKMNVMVDTNERTRICNTPQRAPLWFRSRSRRATASRFGLINGTLPASYSTLEKYLRERFWPRSYRFQGNVCCRYGTRHESHAEHVFVQAGKAGLFSEMNVGDIEIFRRADPRLGTVVTVPDFRVEERGLIIDKTCPHRAYSPDGLVRTGDTWSLLEIKCPYGLKFYPEGVPRHYYDQIQGSMRGLGLSQCFFVVWTPPAVQVHLVAHDTEYTNALFNRIDDFYFNVMFKGYRRVEDRTQTKLEPGDLSFLEGALASFRARHCEDNHDEEDVLDL